MIDTVYVLERDADERRWIESALARQVRELIFLDDGRTLPDWLWLQGGDGLVCGAEPDPDCALELVRSLRRIGQPLPVLMIGAHSAFRTAVELARLPGTDFLQHPVSAQRLCAALHRLIGRAKTTTLH